MKLFILYSVDAWHNNSSKEILSVCTSMAGAVSIAATIARDDGESLNSEQERLLLSISQTQGYSGEGEFLIEEALSDTIL